MSDSFINITKIKSTNTNDNSLKVFQVQPYKNSVTIMHVGNMVKLYDINMHTFDIGDKFMCHMVNKIYDIQLLWEKLLYVEPMIQIISILICEKNNNYPFAHLCINFHPIFDNINKDTIESTYLSSKDNIINIFGKYSISLHLKSGKMIYLDSDYEFLNRESMITDLAEYLLDDEIIKFLCDV